MFLKLCIRLGLVTGGAVGALIGLLYGAVCCTPPHPPTVGQLAGDGLLVALITAVFCIAFTWLVTRLPLLRLLALTLLIATVNGVLLGPLAYHIPHDWLALLLGALLGALLAALLGWLLGRVLCDRNLFTFRKAR